MFLHVSGFSCPTEVLSSSEHAAQLQRSGILEEQGRDCCYTLQCVEKVMKKVRYLSTNTDLIALEHGGRNLQYIMFLACFSFLSQTAPYCCSISVSRQQLEPMQTITGASSQLLQV